MEVSLQARHSHESPSAFLQEVLGRFSRRIYRGRALDLACGQGRNAIFLAEVAFEVEGLDISESAVAAARQAAQVKGLAAAFRQVDLEHADLPEGCYDLIVNCNFLLRTLIPKIKRAVKLGGHVVFDTYLVDQRLAGHPRNLNYLLGHNELLELFRDFRVLYYREGGIGEAGGEEHRACLFGQRVA
jgi:SAM-dependent methyltransferase